MPARPREAPSPVSVETSIKKTDGRKGRATGRTTQFNTRVRLDWLDDFERLVEEESERGEHKITRGRFLEMLTYVWRQQEGKPLPAFGLPDRILAALDKIKDHTGLDDEQALEQALAVYLQKLGLVKTKSAAET